MFTCQGDMSRRLTSNLDSAVNVNTFDDVVAAKEEGLLVFMCPDIVAEGWRLLNVKNKQNLNKAIRSADVFISESRQSPNTFLYAGT